MENVPGVRLKEWAPLLIWCSIDRIPIERQIQAAVILGVMHPRVGKCGNRRTQVQRPYLIFKAGHPKSQIAIHSCVADTGFLAQLAQGRASWLLPGFNGSLDELNAC